MGTDALGTVAFGTDALATFAFAAVSGLGFGLSLIIAIGAQNAFVLRQGLRREHVAAVVLICALSDALLIVVGVSGLGTLLQLVPWLLVVVRIGGAAFLVGYGILAARRALKPGTLRSETGTHGASPLRAVVATCLALTWLNPHVYLDTVILLGSVSATYGSDRWAFGAGAVLGSILWFASLGYGARLLRPVFAKPLAWRILDAGIAIVMFAIAGSLLLGLAG